MERLWRRHHGRRNNGGVTCQRGDQQLLREVRVRLAFRLTHHLTYQRLHRAGLAAPVVRDNLRVFLNHRLHDRLQRGRVRHLSQPLLHDVL